MPRLDRLEDLAEFWSGFQAERYQIIAPHQWRRNDRLVGEFLAFSQEKLVIVEHAMAAFAIDPVQFQLVVKGRSRHKTLQLRESHVWDVLENHVLLDHFDGRLDFSAGKSEASHNRLGHLCTDAVVLVEADSAGFIHCRRDRFAYIVKQDGQDQRDRNFLWKQLQHQPGMHEHVAFGMKLFRLQHAFHRFQLGQNRAHQAAGVEQVPAAHPVRRKENAH